MSRMLDVTELRVVVCRKLCELGFVVVHSSRGTHYLWLPGTAGFRIRVSDHKQGPTTAMRFNNTLKSVVLRPCPKDRVDSIVLNAAIGFMLRRDDRLGLLRSVA